MNAAAFHAHRLTALAAYLSFTFLCTIVTLTIESSDALAQNVFEQNKRAIVKITVTGNDPDGNSKDAVEGSGLIVYSKDFTLLLTAAHLLGSSSKSPALNNDWQIENGRIDRKIKIEGLSADNRFILLSDDASVYRDQPPANLDVAILSLDVQGYPTVKLPPQRPKVGTQYQVALLGYRQGRKKLTFPYQPGRGAELSSGDFETTFPSRLGESGGAWVEEETGIVLAIASGFGTRPDDPRNIATPITFAMRYIEEIINNEDHDFLADAKRRAEAKQQVTRLPSDELFSQLASVYSETRIEFAKLKAVTLAQWAVESGFGRSELAQRHYNFSGLKYRKGIKHCERIKYEVADGHDFFCRFASIPKFIQGYWSMLDRPVYAGWREHGRRPIEFLEFVSPLFAPGSAIYKKKILNALDSVVAEGLIKEPKSDKARSGRIVELPSDLLIKKGKGEKRVALLVAHHLDKPGASGVVGIRNEYDFSKEFLSDLADRLKAEGISARLFSRSRPDLADDRRDLEIYLWRADLAIELHGNASNDGNARGSETIYDARYGESLARIIHNAVVRGLNRQGSLDRGLKDARTSRVGLKTVSNWAVPTIILEPAFIDNEADALLLQRRKPQLLTELTKAIEQYLRAAPEIEHGAPEDNYALPKSLSGFVVNIVRTHTERESGGRQRERTIGQYRVFYDGRRVHGLEGMTVETGGGKGDNSRAGIQRRRLEALTYPLSAHVSPRFSTFGYTTNVAPFARLRPAVKLLNTKERSGILIHPGRGFAAPPGTIILTDQLSGPDDLVVWETSRSKVIELIETMRQKLGFQFPKKAVKVPNAWVVITGEPISAAVSAFAKRRN